MGSATISYAVVALAVGLACLLAGFFWGRSNLKSRVEQAVEQEHTSLDAREFAMRQQVDEAIAEIARLRPLAEELARVQDRLKQEQAKYERMKADFDSTLYGDALENSEQQEVPPAPPQATVTPESADEAIQKLLQSLENLSPQVDPTSGESQPAVPEAPEPAPVREAVAEPRQVAAPVNAPEPPKSSQPSKASESRPKPPSPPQAVPAAAKAPVSSPQPKPGDAVDEWQEFARSLAALTDRKK